MRDHVPRAPERPSGSTSMPPSEKLVCEWEARHDVASRSRQVDAAELLHHYLVHTRTEEELRHQDQPLHGSESLRIRRARHPDEFVAQHPLAASWLRWGEDSY